MNGHKPHQTSYSDTRYVIVLFGLISVVLLLVFLIYFVYGQKQFSADDTTRLSDETGVNTVTIDDVRNGRATDTATRPATDNTPNTTNPTNTGTVPGVLPPVTGDIAYYNPRETNTLSLRGRDLIESYFQSIRDGEYRTACSLLSNTICNAKHDIYAFSQFLNKTNGGYAVTRISLAQEQKPTEIIYCVEYNYTLKADLNPQIITEYAQFRIQGRPDGGEEISARVCEKIIKDGRERPCPIITPKKYCY